jgi:LysM repeat protein
MYCIKYIIKCGDSLYSISRHYNVPISAILDANPLINVYNLIAGETICIPVSVPSGNYTNFTTYLVREEDTLGDILNNSGINLADLLEFNDLEDIYLVPGSTLKVPVAPGRESNIVL